MNRALSWFCQIFLKPVVRLLFVKEVKGWKNIPRTNFILASNHQSHLDIIISGYVCVPRRFTYIGQVDEYTGLTGFLRNFLYLIGEVIPVNRKDEFSRKKALDQAIQVLKRGSILVIYPEGTRTRTGEMGEGKLGVAKLFLETLIPILPVGIKGTFELLPPGGELKIKRIVKINIGKPLYFKEELEKSGILNSESEEYKILCQKIIDKLMKEISNLI